MSKTAVAAANPGPIEVVELKTPVVAAILGWLIPGLGHIYQGRTPKGLLFMISILSTFFYGLFISDGRAVYASWTETDKRLPYLCQVCVGLPALPALVQTYLVREGKDPLLGGVMAPPVDMVQLNDWYKTLNRYLRTGHGLHDDRRAAQCPGDLRCLGRTGAVRLRRRPRGARTTNPRPRASARASIHACRFVRVTPKASETNFDVALGPNQLDVVLAAADRGDQPGLLGARATKRWARSSATRFAWA